MAGKITKSMAPDYVQPLYEQLATDAQNIYGGIKDKRPDGSGIVYQGDRVAGFNDTQNTATGQIVGQTNAYQGLKDQVGQISGGLNSAGLTQGGSAANDVFNRFSKNGLNGLQNKAANVYDRFSQNGLTDLHNESVGMARGLYDRSQKLDLSMTDRQNKAGTIYETFANGNVGADREMAMNTLRLNMGNSDDNFQRALDVQSRELRNGVTGAISEGERAFIENMSASIAKGQQINRRQLARLERVAVNAVNKAKRTIQKRGGDDMAYNLSLFNQPSGSASANGDGWHTVGKSRIRLKP